MKQNMVKRKVALYGSRQLICIHKTDDIYKDIAEDVKIDLIPQIMN